MPMPAHVVTVYNVISYRSLALNAVHTPLPPEHSVPTSPFTLYSREIEVRI